MTRFNFMSLDLRPFAYDYGWFGPAIRRDEELWGDYRTPSAANPRRYRPRRA